MNCEMLVRRLCDALYRNFFTCVLALVVLIFLIQSWAIRFEKGKTSSPCAHRKHLQVPRIIHQSWKTSTLPETFRRYRRSWRACYPKWKHLLWTDATNRHLVMKHFPWFLQTYDYLPHKICRADAARYIYLYLHGGVYADLDTECVRPFTHLLNHSIVLGAMKGKSLMKEGHVQNSFMFSVPRHPFWEKMLRYIADTKHKEGVRPEAITGPTALMIVLKRHKAVCPQDVFVYPPMYFNPFTWMNNTVKACKALGKMTKLEHQECRNAFSDSFVIQYHAHTWE